MCIKHTQMHRTVNSNGYRSNGEPSLEHSYDRAQSIFPLKHCTKRQESGRLQARISKNAWNNSAGKCTEGSISPHNEIGKPALSSSSDFVSILSSFESNQCTARDRVKLLEPVIHWQNQLTSRTRGLEYSATQKDTKEVKGSKQKIERRRNKTGTILKRH